MLTHLKARTRLIDSSTEAKQAITDVESSCFVLCLDSAKPQTIEEEAAQVWYGDWGLNRWYDKPVQFTVNGNGNSGYIGEHSAVDGGSSLRLNDYIQGYIRKDISKPTKALMDDYVQVTALDFPTTSEFSELVKTASSQLKTTIGDEEIVVSTAARFGDNTLSAKKTNSNTFVQLVFNLAAYRMYGELKPNYEPVTLTSFAQGRWTSCSMVTEEVLKFCQLAEDSNASQAAKRAAFEAALKAHAKNVTRTAGGMQNTEAHLLALKTMLRKNEEVPELFADLAHLKSQRWSLSASFLPSVHVHYGGFWPVVEDGIAIGTLIRGDRLDFLTVGSKGQAKEFSAFIEKAAADVGAIVGVTA